MRLLSCNAFIYSLQVLAAVSLVISKAAAFAEDQDPLPFNDNQTKGTQVGDVYEVNISSTYDKSDIKPVTSEDGKTDTYTLMYANASYISVHFRQFDLPSSCSLVITDDNEEEEEQPYTLTGQGKYDLGSFWAHHVNGDTMKLSLSCDDEEDKEFALFEIDQFAAGFPLNNNNPEVQPYERHLRSRTKERSFEEEKMSSFLKAIDEERKLSICGKDDKRNAICYKNSEPTIYNKAKAVARLLINGRFACTGWLVSNGSLLFTNEHCIDSLSDVQNTDFEFMGEESNCAIGSSDGSWFSSRNHAGIYDGTALLKVSATWDYALVQLSRDPASKYGFLELDNRKAGVNEQIYIPQHPGGRPKEIGVFDSNHNGNCRVKGYRRGCAPEDMTYSCDTEGGSSGSPVLSRTNNKVIALHHCGGGCNGNLGAPIYKFYNEIQGFIGPSNEIEVTQDAQIRAGPFVDRNFGSAGVIAVKKSSPYYTRSSIIEFDLSSISKFDIDNIKLGLWLTDNNLPFDITISRLHNDINWSEDTVTWNNFNPSSILKQGSHRLKGSIADKGRMLYVDVSDLINASTNPRVILFLEGNTSGNAIFASKESPFAAHHPKLLFPLSTED